MSFRVNTNVNAMNALRNVGMTGMELGRSISKLSTGLRITSAADDPAGLIISENFRAQISGIDQAIRNNQDAVNYAKTAEGALDEVNRLLRDARTLAVAAG
ncbi:MAG TPA: flagellin, partial [Fimbriimonadaceae bacterium]|nr:flagellin [Fimbriimonadaceae bacterium]